MLRLHLIEEIRVHVSRTWMTSADHVRSTALLREVLMNMKLADDARVELPLLRARNAELERERDALWRVVRELRRVVREQADALGLIAEAVDNHGAAETVVNVARVLRAALGEG